MINRYKLLILVLLALALSFVTNAQDNCSFFGVDLDSQQDVDDFFNWGYDCVEEDLRIEGDDITNLDGLINLVQVKGKLLIGSCPNLQSLSGLDNLERVDDIMSLFELGSVTNAEGLGNLKRINGKLHIRNFPINTLAQMVNLEYVGGLWIQQIDISSIEGLEEWGSGDIRIQDCPNLSSIEGIIPSNTYQSEIKLFNLPNLTSLSGLEVFNGLGGLVIDNTGITNLEGLQNIEYINFNDFQILNNANLISLNGLDQLESSISILIIANNDALTSLEGLPPFTSQGIEIINNDNITSLAGLEPVTFNFSWFQGLKIEGNASLESLNGLNLQDTIIGVEIINNPNLTDLSGFENVKVVEDLRITGNQNLTSLTGLESIENATRTVAIENTNALENFIGLDNLTEVQFLVVENNLHLTDFTGLENLERVSNRIDIQNNPALKSIKEMIRLDTVGGIVIENNESLSQCEAYGICSNIFGSSIINNQTGCNTQTELTIACSTLPKVQARTYYDYNQNKIQDANETGLDIILTMYPQNQDYNIAGNSLFFVGANNTIAFEAANNSPWAVTTDSLTYTLGTAEGDNTFAPFGLYPTEQISKIETLITSPPARCNNEVPFTITAKNVGTTVADGVLWFTIDENVTSIDFEQQPDTTVADFNAYGWFFEDLFPAQTFSQTILLGVPGPPDFPVGDLLYFVGITNFTDVNGDDSSEGFRYNPEVRCSFDPNDKLINPNRPFNEVLFGEDLYYTIRFQNTGNDVAYDVFIKDTIDTNLDLSTLRILDSSHPDILVTSIDEDRIVTFDFPNIFLPDSTSNPIGSNGYVAYKISPYPGLDVQTNITNNAGIYFDQNPPIITNTVNSILVDMLTSTTTPTATSPTKLLPNPNAGIFNLTGIQEGTYEIINTNGQHIQNGQITDNTSFDISTQPDGIYFIHINTAQQIITKRFIKIGR